MVSLAVFLFSRPLGVAGVRLGLYVLRSTLFFIGRSVEVTEVTVDET